MPTSPSFKKETLIPRWETLILEDKEGAWLGRVLYSRKQRSLTGTAPAAMSGTTRSSSMSSTLKSSGRPLPQPHRRPAARLNRFLTKAVPSYEEEGIEHWLARFKFE